MSQVVKAFVGIFFIMVFTMLGTGIVGAQMESAYARDYKENVIAEIENSDLSRQVIDSCIMQAKRDGYDLKVQIYKKNEQKTAEICLAYEYRIGFLNYVSRHEIWGYVI